MDKYGFEGQKISYHPANIAAWLSAKNNWEQAKTIYPIYMEISPSGACNHRCIFCALDYMGYKPVFLDLEKTKQCFKNMAEKGVKSIMFGGEGEPLLHPRIIELNNCAVDYGLDVGYTSNGVLMDEKFIQAVLPHAAWIKISLDAGTAENYARIHKTKPADFDKVLENLKYAVAYKKANNLKCVLGAQLLLLPENANEVMQLAKILKDIGVDYFVVKPYSQHQFSVHHTYENIKYEQYLSLDNELKNIATADFNIIFRGHTMKKWDNKERPYKICQAVPFFWAYITAAGDVYSCSAFLGDDRFNLGNINHSAFSEIWESEKRKANWNLMCADFDINVCRNNCRMDEVNRFLWRVANAPPEHVNFI